MTVHEVMNRKVKRLLIDSILAIRTIKFLINPIVEESFRSPRNIMALCRVNSRVIPMSHIKSPVSETSERPRENADRNIDGIFKEIFGDNIG